MKKFAEIVAESREYIDEVFPWDVDDIMKQDNDSLILDIREEWERVSAESGPILANTPQISRSDSMPYIGGWGKVYLYKCSRKSLEPSHGLFRLQL